MKKSQKLVYLAWGLGALVSILALIVWSQERLGRGGLGLYDLFPLFGLLAFSLMWTHYIIGAARRYNGEGKQVVKPYMVASSVIVLACILLHPGLLWYQLWVDGFGAPPKSHLNAYPEAQYFGLLLGSISLLIFLSFELKKWLEKKAAWKYIEYLQLVAMFMIFYHGLMLGRELAQPWYRFVWFMYGVTLFASIVYNHKIDKKNKSVKEGV